MKRSERRYSEEKISLAKKRLDSLEEKCTGKTRDEVVCDLEKNIKKALEKGYTLKEISETLAEEEIFLPAGFLKAHLLKSPKQKTSSTVADTKEKAQNQQQKKDKPTKEQEKEIPVTREGEHYNFVKPDTPDDEL